MSHAPLITFLNVASLPPRVAEALVAHCKATGESADQVIADAVDLHLDCLGELIDDRDVAAHFNDHGADVDATSSS